MGNVPNTRAGDKIYDELKLKREGIYMQCVPILKKLIQIDSKSNIEAIQTLKNIYATVGDTVGFDEMKALLEEVESK